VNEDSVWSYDHIMDHTDVIECAAGRSVVDGITHRVVCSRLTSGVETGWCTLCNRRPASLRVRWSPELVDRPVDCMACISAGG
jgi:hypothetical protein